MEKNRELALLRGWKEKARQNRAVELRGYVKKLLDRALLDYLQENPANLILA